MKFFYAILVLVIGVIGYYLGSTVGMFGGNLCYMASINDVSEIYLKAMDQNDSKYRQAVKLFIQELPNYGYESTCIELKAHVDLFLGEWK